MSKWILKNKKVSTEFEPFVKRGDLSYIAAKILANRGINKLDQIENFLNPSISKFHNSFDINDMQKTVMLLLKCIKKGCKIAIYGDYDADGIMSTVILFKAFKRLGANVIYYIPDREAEGYGINIDSIYKLKDLEVDTIFTCDNGIAAIEEIKLAKSLDMNVFVLDHHEVRLDELGNQILPIADTVIDVKRTDCNYPFKDMCAAGISYKFVLELYKACNIDLKETEDFIIYAAIATICDVVDLLDENRIIVKQGLDLINKTKNIGLNSLIMATGLTSKKIGVYQVGFILGPCINATGRLDHAGTAVKLFITDNSDEAYDLALKLVSLNNERKSMTVKAVERVIKSVEQNGIENNKVLIVYDEEIHESIAGIIAGKVREYFYLPTIILTKGDKMAKGSARSIEGYNIFEELCKCSELLDRFGGHPMAAGMSLKHENIDLLRQKLNDLCVLTKEDMIPQIKIDAKLPIDNINFELVNEIERLSPFGKGNESPIFGEKNVIILKVDVIGKLKNILKFKCLSESGKSITAISFDGYDEFKKIIYDKYNELIFNDIISGKNLKFELKLDFIYTVSVDNFNGNEALQMLIKEFRLSE